MTGSKPRSPQTPLSPEGQLAIRLNQLAASKAQVVEATERHRSVGLRRVGRAVDCGGLENR